MPSRLWFETVQCLPGHQRKHAEEASPLWDPSLLWSLSTPAANKTQREVERFLMQHFRFYNWMSCFGATVESLKLWEKLLCADSALQDNPISSQWCCCWHWNISFFSVFKLYALLLLANNIFIFCYLYSCWCISVMSFRWVCTLLERDLIFFWLFTTEATRRKN